MPTTGATSRAPTRAPKPPPTTEQRAKERMPIYDGVFELVGKTPLVRLRKLSPVGGAEVCAKLESKNPGGSVKDRPALAMMLAAEQAGQLNRGATIVEATSGNTGISLA